MSDVTNGADINGGLTGNLVKEGEIVCERRIKSNSGPSFYPCTYDFRAQGREFGRIDRFGVLRHQMRLRGLLRSLHVFVFWRGTHGRVSVREIKGRASPRRLSCATEEFLLYRTRPHIFSSDPGFFSVTYAT
jgi:hypothetical protein